MSLQFAVMSKAGIHRGFLKKYGGFMFKQWREKFMVLTLEGSLCVCRDAETPPDQVVALLSNCESIAEGREILDLPRLPAGGRRDCCFALILPQNKYLLLLADNPEDCRSSVVEAAEESERGHGFIFDPAEAAQHRSLHHRQRSSPGHAQKRTRVSAHRRDDPPTLTLGQSRRFLQRQGTDHRSLHAPTLVAQRVGRAAPPRVRLPSPRQQQRRPGRAGRVPPDGRGCSLLGAGLPEHLYPHLAPGHPGPRDGARLRGIRRAPRRRQPLPRLQPGRGLAALQQLRLRGRRGFRHVRLRGVRLLIRRET